LRGLTDGFFQKSKVTKVSVIIPTYNRAATVLDAIRSALNQSYPYLEVIVVDDGSSDGTTKLLEEYSKRIKLLHQENAGPSAARNLGARHASGDVFAFLDSDDVWMPEKIERQVALMDQWGGMMTCCVCNSLIFNELKNETCDAFGIAAMDCEHERAVWKNPGEVLASRFLLFNQVAAIRRESFIRLGGFNTRMRVLEDYELALRLAAMGGVWGIISTPLVQKRNNTRGIGVVCCENSLAHARAQRIAMAAVFESGLIRDGKMRRQLKGRLNANAREIRNETRLASSAWFQRALGCVGRVWLRGIKFISRKRFPKAETEEFFVINRNRHECNHD